MHTHKSDSGKGTPGEVIDITDAAIEIAAGDGSLLIHILQPAGSGKIPAPEFVQTFELKAGDRFNS